MTTIVKLHNKVLWTIPYFSISFPRQPPWWHQVDCSRRKILEILSNGTTYCMFFSRFYHFDLSDHILICCSFIRRFVSDSACGNHSKTTSVPFDENRRTTLREATRIDNKVVGIMRIQWDHRRKKESSSCHQSNAYSIRPIILSGQDFEEYLKMVSEETAVVLLPCPGLSTVSSVRLTRVLFLLTLLYFDRLIKKLPPPLPLSRRKFSRRMRKAVKPLVLSILEIVTSM